MSKEYSVNGKVTEVGEVEEFANDFKKRTIVIEVTDGEYKNHLAIDFVKAKAEASSSINVGDEVEVKFNLRSNQATNGKWYTNAQGWKWNVEKSASDGGSTNY